MGAPMDIQQALVEAVRRADRAGANALIVYLDTVVAPVPERALAECADFAGLRCEVVPAPLDHLEDLIDDALRRVGALGCE